MTAAPLGVTLRSVTGQSTNPEAEELWRGLLLGTDPRYANNSRLFRRIPGGPARCKMCSAPFGFPGRVLMHFMHRDPWAKNPKYCEFCFRVLDQFKGGAEIPSTFLFADVRGSTALAETMSATLFHQLLNRFYEVASDILVSHDAIVDKFVGDEVVAIFIPALAGERHAAHAIDAARDLLVATRADAIAPVPIGIGIHTGTAYVGSVGQPPITDFTALGDVVNTTARLASAAGAGELLVSREAAQAGDLETSGLEVRSLELKGKATAVDVVVLASPEAVAVA